MFFVLLTLTIGIGYVAYQMSAPFKHRTPMFFLFSGLLALAAGFLFKALFLL